MLLNKLNSKLYYHERYRKANKGTLILVCNLLIPYSLG